MHQRDLVHDGGGMRKQFAHPRAGLAALPELAPRAQEVRAMAAAHERKAFSFNKRLRDGLAVELNQLRLVVEQLELARSAGHEKVNDVLRPSPEMWQARGHQVGGLARRGAEQSVLAGHGRQSNAAQSHPAPAE